MSDNNVRLDWNGPACQREIQALIKRGLYSAGLLVQRRAKELLSVSGTGGGKGKKRKRKYGSEPSAPGEPPRKQRGTLRASVSVDADDKECRVGTNLKYGLYLELGTRKLKARPWLRRALAETESKIKPIFEQLINALKAKP